MTSAELHIASLVVHAAPRRLERVASEVAAIPGGEVHASAPNGKLVVTLEASSGDEMSRKVATIGRIDGVLSTALVYQCADTLEAMNEEIDDAQAGVH
ncbi:MAG TPA: chaperone NapD [Caldimonas sp.]|jgi:periplasmic nitrate reductase NapD|nr:chaperone NapD [Caldimonas sp.]